MCVSLLRKCTLRRLTGPRSPRPIGSVVGSRGYSDRLRSLWSSHESALRQLLHPTDILVCRPAAFDRELFPVTDRQHGPEQIGRFLEFAKSLQTSLFC